MARRLITLAILLTAAAALAWSFWSRPVAVETAVVARRDITVTVEEEGKARIREVFTVSAPISGQTLRTSLHAGDEVVKDETVVASIRPAAPGLLDARLKRVAEAAAAAASAGVGLAEAEVKQAEAQLTFRKTELSRTERLSSQGTVSESARDKARLEVDTATAALDSARASLAVRQRELERAQAALIETGTSGGPCCTDIKAPASGRILRVLTESEQVVEAGTPLMEIGNPADLEIVSDVLSRDAVKIKPGATAIIEDWGGPPLTATVRRVDPSATTKISALGIEEQRVAVILDAADPTSTTQLGDGFRVVAKITVWEGKDVIAAPISALFRIGNEWAVYRVSDDHAVVQRVTLGRQNDEYAEVTSGLDAGTNVIVHPSDEIAQGATVTAIPHR